MGLVNERVKNAEEFVADFESIPESKLRALSPERRDVFQDEYLTQKCITDFWAFHRYMYADAMSHYWPPLHGPNGLAGYLQNWTKKSSRGEVVPVSVKFIVIAREHCKTQEAILWDVWQWVRDPNYRCLLRAYNDPKAAEISLAIRSTIEKQRFASRFNWVRPATVNNKRILWKASQFLLQRDNVSLRSPSVEACGVKTDPTGGHFDFGHYDDFEVRENTVSDKDRLHMLKTWRADSNLFVAGASRIVCGTPWHKHALINAVCHRLNIDDAPDFGDFTKHEYDVFYQPCTVVQDFSPYDISEPRLYEDRLTVKCDMAGFPTVCNNLTFCQVRATFHDPAMHDIVTETREAVWNDEDTIRVNRPFSSHLGQPLQLWIGNEKPAAPNRCTLDCIDLDQRTRHERPIEINSYNIARTSLPKKRIEQGTFMFSGQMDLKPIDGASVVFDKDDVVRVDEEDLPKERLYYRACDFATAQKTAASNVITYGFWTTSDFYITKVVKKNMMKSSEKIRELILGAHRLQKAGYPIRCTFFENANIEKTLMEFIQQAQRNPFEYFTALGGTDKMIAETEFADSGPIHFMHRVIKRSAAKNKELRIEEIQPFVQGGHLKIVKGCEGEAVFFEELGTFTRDGGGTFDILDTVRDLVAEGRPMANAVLHRTDSAAFPSWLQVQQRAMLRSGRSLDGAFAGSA